MRAAASQQRLRSWERDRAAARFCTMPRAAGAGGGPRRSPIAAGDARRGGRGAGCAEAAIRTIARTRSGRRPSRSSGSEARGASSSPDRRRPGRCCSAQPPQRPKCGQAGSSLRSASIRSRPAGGWRRPAAAPGARASARPAGPKGTVDRGRRPRRPIPSPPAPSASTSDAAAGVTGRAAAHGCRRHEPHQAEAALAGREVDDAR